MEHFNMTPYEAYRIEQERVEQQDAIANQLYLDGITDGAFGYKAQCVDNAYLTGYLEGIKQLPRDNSGKILYDRDSQPTAIENF